MKSGCLLRTLLPLSLLHNLGTEFPIVEKKIVVQVIKPSLDEQAGPGGQLIRALSKGGSWLPRTESLEKTLMLENIEGRRRRG